MLTFHKFIDLYEIIDQKDDRVLFNEISPYRAETGSTVTLKGCGWFPLDDITVFFQGEIGTVEANVLSSTIENTKKVAKTRQAKSHPIATNKLTRLRGRRTP